MLRRFTAVPQVKSETPGWYITFDRLDGITKTLYFELARLGPVQ